MHNITISDAYLLRETTTIDQRQNCCCFLICSHMILVMLLFLDNEPADLELDFPLD